MKSHLRPQNELGRHKLCSLTQTISCKNWKLVILKYVTTHNHPKPLTTIHNHPKNHPQPSATSHNHPQLPKTIHNHPQLPKKPPTNIHSYPKNHPQPTTTIQNHPKITRKSQDLSQTVMLLHFRCSYWNRRWVLIVIRNNGIYTCVCVCVNILYKSLHWLFFG